MTLAEKLSEALGSQMSEGLVSRLEAFIGEPLKDGRMTVKGYPVDFDSANSDDDGVEATAVDKDAATGLAKVLRAAGFKVALSKNNGLLITDGK